MRRKEVARKEGRSIQDEEEEWGETKASGDWGGGGSQSGCAISMCPHNAIYMFLHTGGGGSQSGCASSYCYMRVRILLYTSAYCCTCVCILRYMCLHTAMYVSAYWSVCVRILLYVFPRATTCVSAYCGISSVLTHCYTWALVLLGSGAAAIKVNIKPLAGAASSSTSTKPPQVYFISSYTVLYIYTLLYYIYFSYTSTKPLQVYYYVCSVLTLVCVCVASR